MKFKKKIIVIDAYQLIPENVEQIIEWSTNERPIVIISHDEAVEGISYAEITTLEGVMKANYGDWIIKGVKGEVYPCKPDIFEQTYEPIDL